MKITIVLAVPIFVVVALILSTQSEIINITIETKRPRVVENPPHFYGIVNTPQQYSDTARVTYLSVCKFSGKNLNATLRYDWKIADRNRPDKPLEFVTGRCYLKWQAIHEGNFDIDVTVYLDSKRQQILGKGHIRDFMVKDIWIAAIGDSFASGQGNPDQQVKMMGIVPATWISAECCRSGKSWPYFTHRMIAEAYPDHGILFTYVACAGSSIPSGILGPGPEHTGMKPQLRQLSEIKMKGGEYFWRKCLQHFGNGTICREAGIPRNPDAILMSIGGNDIGFSEIMFSILWGNSEPIFQDMLKKFASLRRGFDDLAAGISEQLNMTADRIIIPHYFDITKNELGHIDASCKGLYSATNEEFKQADAEILRRMNAMISQAKDRYGWTVVDNVTQIFDRHGFCSKESFILSIEDSFKRQGNYFGAFHPNEVAHYKIAKLVWKKIENRLDLPASN